MARNSSGVYSLYTPGNPTVPSTTITTTWANNTLSDIATALTDSLSRTGLGGMSAPLQLAAGAVGAPGLSWTAEPTSGLYRVGAADFGYSIGGVRTLGLNTNQLLVRDGAVGTPALSFLSDTNTGLYSGGADILSFATAGVLSGSITAAGNFNWRDGTAPLPAFSFTSDPDTGLYRSAANTVAVATNGVLLAQFSATALGLIDGSAATPPYTFTSDPNTGMYSFGADQIGFTAGGTVQLRVRTNSIDFYTSGALDAQVQNGRLFTNDGLAGSPAISFVSDATTGLYRSAAGRVAFSCAGTLQGLVRAGSWDFNPGGGAVTTQIQAGGIFVPNGSNTGPSLAFANDATTGFFTNGSGQLQLTESGGTGFRVGYRAIPRSTTATTLAASDLGKCVAITAAINIPASVFSAGDALTIYNDSAGALNLTISAGTLRLSGTATTGTRSIASRGLCTIWFNVGGATPEVIASGNVT